MLKKPITYKDFNGVEITEEFYFNLSEPEIVEMEVEYPQGLSSLIEEIIKTKDHKTLVKIMKDLILRCYGQKSQDGRRFIKSDELRTEFSQTGAYIALFMDLATNDGSAANFIKGVLPESLTADVEKKLAEVTLIKSD